MAKRKLKNSSISPVDPSLHYILLLVLALFLVVVVAVVMQKTAVDTRARLVCPNMNDSSLSLQNARNQCVYGMKLSKDENGCSVWTCTESSETGEE